ncbi:SUKH-3 domain-containing protein [Streptomyces sp. NPDC093546]|uniref:SUKH-3 domain-containing protein n=1 Tax=Streptomyces sp. NPDC093546 TaxID=3366040 RepID=UPI0037F883B9
MSRRQVIRAIAGLWQEAERLDRPAAALRVPGIAPGEVREAFGGPVPDDVAVWFGHANGVAWRSGQTRDDAALVPGYEPLAVRDAAALRGSSAEQWFPLLGTGGGDFYAAVPAPGAGASPVVSVMAGEEPRPAYGSVEDMADAFRDLYRAGVFFVAEDGTLDADDELWIAIETAGTRPRLDHLRRAADGAVRLDLRDIDVPAACAAYAEAGYGVTLQLVEFLAAYGELTLGWTPRFGRGTPVLTVSVEAAIDDFAPNMRYYARRLGMPVLPVGTAFETYETVLLAENGDILFAGDAGMQRVGHGFEGAVRALISGEWDRTFF